MQFTLNRTSNINVLVGIWIHYYSNKNYVAIPVSFCSSPEHLHGSSMKKDILTRDYPNTHLIELHNVSASHHTSDYLKQVLEGALGVEIVEIWCLDHVLDIILKDMIKIF